MAIDLNSITQKEEKSIVNKLFARAAKIMKRVNYIFALISG